jgi:glycosyltransferase involved in cell wall biosynthesis
MSNRVALIVPCYNEARRLDVDALGALLADAEVELWVVDDGSTDATRDVLERMARDRPGRVHVVALAQNGGKAEAVRRGLGAAIEASAHIVGYLDADLATPADEMLRLIDLLRRSDAQVLMGARVALLGHAIDRRAIRHYLGRVFATLASLSLRLRVYDTQCGAKLFRASAALADAVREPFLSRWAFDVELLGRLLLGSPTAPAIAASSIWEEPLHDWTDVAGSKLSARQMVRSLLDLARIEADFVARRARRAAPARPTVTREAEPARVAR